MSLADSVLGWVLRHGKAADAPELHDLVLVYDHEALADPSHAQDFGGTTWRIQRVTGELTLRDALLEAGRLIALVPERFVIPMDLAGRAWLGRPARVQPRDLVAALTGRPCEPIVDEQVAEGVLAALPQLREMDGSWSRGGTVTVREIRNVLLGLQVGSEHRFDRETPEGLLARWITEGTPEVTSAGLLTEALRQEHGKVGGWLAWAVTEGSVEDLVAAGALSGSEAGIKSAPDVPGLSGPSDRQRIKSIVEQGVRRAWEANPTRTRGVLAGAERRASSLPADVAPRHPLLEGLLARFLTDAARHAAAGEPVDDVALEALSTHLHLSAHSEAWSLTRDLTRLARFVQIVEVPEHGSLTAWAELARTHVAWGDLAFRRARRRLGDADGRLVEPAKLVLGHYTDLRDELNAAFAAWLATHWGTVAGQVDRRQPFALHHLARLVLRPLLNDGQRVLLVVLDGCDLASFVDLIEDAAESHGVALSLPEFTDPDLREGLKGSGAWRVAMAPLPTVTSHARRALFAGDLPHAASLDDTESAAANASHDKKAFAENPALGSVSRTLLLKGDVGDLGESVREALDGPHKLVAVVLNDVDDALSSKETTPMRPWALEALGAGAPSWLKHAVGSGWTVVVTADHGHTPYVSSSRKVKVPGAGGRIASEPDKGVTTVSTGPLPDAPLHLLHGFGTWRGSQRRGWHGGVGLEEVFVPFALLRKGAVHDDSFRKPLWWSRLPEVETSSEDQPGVGTEASAVRSDGGSNDDVPAEVEAALKFFPRGLELVGRLVGQDGVEISQLERAMGLSEAEVRGLVEHVLDFLAKAKLDHTILVDGTTLRWSAEAGSGREEGWLDRISDASDRQVLAYLHRHGALIERDLVELIGHPRRARRFATKVEALSALAPFRIIVEALPDGSKRYSTVQD